MLLRMTALLLILALGLLAGPVPAGGAGSGYVR